MRILIGLDGSDVSRRAAQEASRIFGSQAEYLVINVAEAPLPWVGPEGMGAVFPMGAVPLWPAETRDTPVSLEGTGLAAPAVLKEHGEAVTEICRAAEEHEVDVIVVGAHHKGIVERLLDPSVVPALLRHAQRPVLVIPERTD